MIQEQESLNKKLQDQNNELIESQNQYRIILEKSSDGIFCLDAAGKIVSGNARFSAFLGFEVKELIGRSIMGIVNSGDPSGIYPKIMTRRFGDRATVNLKIQFCINENSPIWPERKYYSLLLDSYGIWNLPNNEIYEKGIEKTFMGATCIVKKPS